ncbi:MAG: hypothetical protein J7K15_00740, partial [Deltaproteobacteria bacterium]|nr:hypothetical protein [Deltaproteobacteria bacterium]
TTKNPINFCSIYLSPVPKRSIINGLFYGLTTMAIEFTAIGQKKWALEPSINGPFVPASEKVPLVGVHSQP